jgi:putative ABC transport system permease protein
VKLDYIIYSLNHIAGRKMRSFLTILSILIGIAAIYALVSFGQGLSSYVNDMSSKIGVDKLMISAKSAGAPGTDANFYVSSQELDVISKVNGISSVAGMYAKVVEIESQRQKKYTYCIGLPMGNELKLFLEMAGIELDRGRSLKNGDKLKAVFGNNFLFNKKIFDKALRVGDKVSVNGNIVEVVGFYSAVGNPADDAQIYFTTEGMELMFPEIKDKFSYGIAQVEKGDNATLVAEKAKERLRKFKGEKEGQESFDIMSFQQAIEIFSTIITVINAILLLIALISVIVASVNIMNTMYTAVLERTKEIGIMKAIGAQNRDIAFIFLFESGVLGLIGGAAGICFGYVIAKIGGAIALAAGYGLLKPVFPWILTVGCLLFATFVGVVSGFFPAKAASKLKPVDALRYE